MSNPFVDLLEDLEEKRDAKSKTSKKTEVHYDLLMDEYLSHPYIGSSLLKTILINPAEFKASLNIVNKDTKSTVLGTAIHAAVLEPDLFYESYALQPEDWGPRNKGDGYKKWKEFKESNNDKTCLGFEDASLVNRILQAAQSHKALRRVLSQGKAEVTVFHRWHDQFGLKARSDLLVEQDGFLWDVKSSSKDLDDQEIEKTIFQNGYHFQLAHHMKVFKHAGVDIKGFGWIFISTQTAAVHIVMRKASSALIDAGFKDHAYALSLLKKCIETNSWPGYDDGISEVGLPRYAEKFYED